ncbi:MAG TPA: Ig-like domain-containing protein, partial [Thermoplasmata archaeon]|nr:Ig-like domain-containing protein [Thermoplasmata archaeon]
MGHQMQRERILAASILLALAFALPIPMGASARDGFVEAPAFGILPARSHPASSSSTAPDYTKFTQIWAQGTNGNKATWSADYSPNGSWVVMGQASDGGMEVRVMDSSSGAKIKEFEMGGDVFATRFSPDGTRLAMAGKDQRIVVANTSDWSVEQRLPNIQLTDEINDVAWSDDSRYLFLALGSGGNDGFVWVADSQNGYKAASTMNKQFTKRPVFSIDATANSYAVGLNEVTATSDSYVYAIPSGAEVRHSWISSDCLRVRFDTTGRYLAIARATNRQTGTIPTEADAIVWDTAQNYSGTGGRPHVDFSLHANNLMVRALGWSPDDKVLVTGGTGTGDQVRYWWSSNGSEIAHYNIGNPRGAAFSPDGMSVFFAHENQGARWGDSSSPSVATVDFELPDRNGSLYVPRFVKAETAVWVVTFTEDMNTNVAPQASLGQTTPFDQFPMTPGGWRTPRVWTGSYDLRDPSVQEGGYAIQVKGAKDVSGNVMTTYQAFEWVLDRTAPTVQSTLPPYWWRAPSATVAVSFDDPLPANVSEQSKLHDITGEYVFSSDANSTWGGPFPTNTSALNGVASWAGNLSIGLKSGEGHYRFLLRLRDRATNEGTTARPPALATVDLGFDATPPSISRFGTGKQWGSGTTIDLPYQVDDGVGLARLDVSAWYSSDGSNWSALPGVQQNLSGLSSNGTVSYPAPQEGWYKFDAVAWDESGLASAKASASEGKDQKPPESSLAALPPLTNDPDFMLAYTASDSASGIAFVDAEYRVAGGQWAFAGNGGGTSGKIAWRAPADGVYEFRSIAEDVAGNRETPPQGNDTWSRLDTTPPKVVPVNPPDGAVGVPTSVVISATLSEPIDLNTITARLSTSTGQVQGSMKVNALALTFTPAAPLAIATKHTLTVEAFDLAGNKGLTAWGFTTAIPPDGVSPKVTGTVPERGSVVSSLSSVTVNFDEPMSSTTLESPTVSPGNAVGVAIGADKRSVSFAIDPVTEGTTYTVTIAAASARDASGEMLDGNGDGKGGDDFVFSFQVSTRPGGSVRAVVFGADQQRVAGATVTLLSGGNELRAAASDAKGEALFEGL